MNKMIKGSIAGATGVALLMGGFGTYALWSDSENLQAAKVQSGELDIATSAGVWDDANTAASNDWNASDKMVPGDKVTYTQTFTVKAEGKNLKGTVAYVKPSLSGNTFSNALTHTVDVTSSSATITGSGTSFSFNQPFGTATLTAKVTYTLPASVSNQVDQNKEATLPAAAFTITQS
ncbi:alternate-type signal peptide domain-containing protein [Nocardioides sp. GXQ0305]|jgi:alternate signal-mediated exported protein|uniref:alternate-type signal peptide domain-containing protein n=1 Tax=Nocardioides sp. GXQ0305 TaxID=3423912 RepID=UPI003D7E8190